MMYIGRLITGLGAGGVTVVVPLVRLPPSTFPFPFHHIPILMVEENST
jgi:hypothetical protein